MRAEEINRNEEDTKEFAKHAVTRHARVCGFRLLRLRDQAAFACLRVLLAFFAELLRDADPRLRAAVRACRERDSCEAAERPFFLSAFEVARDRLGDVRRVE